MESQIWFFRGMSLNERLPQEVFDSLKKEGRLERWGHMADIFHDSDQGRVYVVLEGGVFIHDGTGEQKHRLKRGDVFGGLVPDDVLPEDADPEFRRKLQAFDDTLLVSLARPNFDELIQPHLSTFDVELGRMRKKRQYTLPISPLLYASPSDRFARVFLHLAETQGDLDGKKARLDFPFHPKRIAPLLGVDRQYSKQLAEQFMRRGLIENAPGFVTIPDMDALRAVLKRGV